MPEQQIKIPTLVALVLVALMSVGGLFAYDQFSSFFGKAGVSPQISPEKITISNITDSSAVVSWTTSEPIAATVRYEYEETEEIAYDIRDTDNIPKQYTVHYAPLSHIPENTTVTVYIQHGDSSYPADSFTTGPDIGPPPSSLPVYGIIQTNQESGTEGAIVNITLDNTVSWTTFISHTNEWIVPTAPMRIAEKTAYYCTEDRCHNDTSIKIEITAEEGTTSYEGKLADTRPLEERLAVGSADETTIQIPTPTDIPIVKGSSTTTDADTTLKSKLTNETNTTIESENPESYTIRIVSPKEEARLRFNKPLFRGEAIPGNKVQASLKGPVEQIGTVTTQENGRWLWTPPIPLSPDTYEISITTKDDTNRTVYLSRTFYITKSGEQVLSSSTPSATLSPSLSPSPIVILTPTETPTPTPIIPTSTPIPDMPESASYAPSIIMIGGGLLLLLLSLAVL